MGTRQVPLCWPEPGCSVSGYSSMSLVSASSGHAEGTDTLQSLVMVASTAVSGDCYSLGYSVARESVSRAVA
jgi:hypothetical protein